MYTISIHTPSSALRETGQDPHRVEDDRLIAYCPAHQDLLRSRTVELVEDEVLLACEQGCTRRQMGDLVSTTVAPVRRPAGDE